MVCFSAKALIQEILQDQECSCTHCSQQGMLLPFPKQHGRACCVLAGRLNDDNSLIGSAV